MTRSPAVRVSAFGDAAVLLELDGEVGPITSRRVRAMAATIEAATADRPGWGRPVPGATSLLVPVDAIGPGATAAVRRLRRLIADLDPALVMTLTAVTQERRPRFEIAVRYGGDDGPDLPAVADLTGLLPAQVVEAHAAVEYEVLFLGFAPGFAYLGPLDPRLVLPRLDAPRVSVPAGSVGIAGTQTAVYPFDSPGGWRLIGRTGVRVWDPVRERPALLGPGDRVRFVPDRGRRA